MFWLSKIIGMSYNLERMEYLLFFCFVIARYYINYKMMKKKVKQYVQQTQTGGKNREQVLKEFSRVLDDQVQMN